MSGGVSTQDLSIIKGLTNDDIKKAPPSRVRWAEKTRTEPLIRLKQKMLKWRVDQELKEENLSNQQTYQPKKDQKTNSQATE